MTVVHCVDQLDVHDDAVSLAPYTAFENIGNVKFLSDFAQIARGIASVLHHRRATDDLQVPDLRETREDVVLDPVRKKCIAFLVTEVFERKYGYALLLFGPFARVRAAMQH